ncbi:MAG: IS256-like element ISRm5 family transposase [Anaerolineales bacterium]
MRLALRYTLLCVLEEEVEAVCQAAPYQRTAQRRDYRNGVYERSLGTTQGLIEDLPVPRTRHGFRTQLFERYQRRMAELDKAIGEMFVKGVSTAGVGTVMEALTGIQPSAATVSRVFHSLEAEFAAWKTRPLKAHYLYLYADGTYFTVIYNQEGYKMPILAIVGAPETGQRDVLAFCVGERENQQAWEDLLEDLKQRGVQAVDLWVTDGNQAMLNAIQNKFPASRRQRCIKHKMDNVLAYVPHKQQERVRSEFKAIFYQESRQQAEQVLAAFIAKYENVYPSAMACLRRDLDACLTFYDFPKEHWRYLCTTNVIERLFNEVKRRSHKMAAAFRNENTCLLMFYAVTRSLKLRKIAIPNKETKPQLLHNS